MAVITPSVTATTVQEYNQQIERVAGFANRLHIDVADGVFAPATVPVGQCWWPVNVMADIHVMYQQPWSQWESLLSLLPRLIIVHAEAELDDLPAVADELHTMGIGIGLALLQPTPVTAIDKSWWQFLDHVVIFSGDLGHYGGQADLSLLRKVAAIRKRRPDIEIGWDGGAHPDNVAELSQQGIDVITSGGFIQHASSPIDAYVDLAHRCV